MKEIFKFLLLIIFGRIYMLIVKFIEINIGLNFKEILTFW